MSTSAALLKNFLASLISRRLSKVRQVLLRVFSERANSEHLFDRRAQDSIVLRDDESQNYRHQLDLVEHFQQALYDLFLLLGKCPEVPLRRFQDRVDLGSRRPIAERVRVPDPAVPNLLDIVVREPTTRLNVVCFVFDTEEILPAAIAHLRHLAMQGEAVVQIVCRSPVSSPHRPSRSLSRHAGTLPYSGRWAVRLRVVPLATSTAAPKKGRRRKSRTGGPDATAPFLSRSIRARRRRWRSERSVSCASCRPVPSSYCRSCENTGDSGSSDPVRIRQCSVSAGASRGSDTGRVGKRSRKVV